MWSARSAARTNDVDGDERRRTLTAARKGPLADSLTHTATITGSPPPLRQPLESAIPQRG